MTFNDFAKLCSVAGLRARNCGRGHWRVEGGKVEVNWWPFSKRRTVWVGGTVGATSTSGDAALAIHSAGVGSPAMVPGKTKVKRMSADKAKAIKDFWHREGRTVLCRWCKKKIDRKETTVDHVVPLHRGGGNYDSNLVPACDLCNKGRGSELGQPEVKNARPE